MIPAHTPNTTPIHRLRVVLRMTGDAQLHAHHGGVLYALIANAYGQATRHDPALPDGLMLDAPEQCRVRLQAGEQYAFGFTLLDADSKAATTTARLILLGLRRIGGSQDRSPHSRHPFDGNFKIEQAEDLIAGQPFDSHQSLTCLSRNVITEQINRISHLRQITLRFTSPLRIDRPRSAHTPGHRYFDREMFDPAFFNQRLVGRLAMLGIQCEDSSSAIAAGERITVSNNQLIWLDMAYGPGKSRKTLGGAVGRIVLHIDDTIAIATLVWGQYVRLGRSTRFGFGCYRITELGEDPFACQRADGLIDLACASPALDQAAESFDVPSGHVQVLADQVASGAYRPSEPVHITIHDRDGQPRSLTIPAPQDRALQRALLDQVAPALDKFFESSSFAWRKGLSRHSAARRIRQASREGYRYAIREDFDRFFDTIDHKELAARLEAYLADDQAVSLIMRWVRCPVGGGQSTGCGLPTGAPLSPLLGNLFLDTFDERIAAEGGLLVRYADDFMILFKEEEQARNFAECLADAADSLRLKLNDNGESIIDLRHPFTFLGFRFEHDQQWRISSGNRLQLLDELGWSDASVSAVSMPDPIRLPAETDTMPLGQPSVHIFGPGVEAMAVDNHHLICSYDSGRAPQAVSLDHVQQIILLGVPGITRQAMKMILDHHVAVLLADRNGRCHAQLLPETPPQDAQTVVAQVEASQNPAKCLAIAKQLVAAKLLNYAALAQAAPQRHPQDDQTAESLREAARSIKTCQTTEQLLGIEGAAAANWYRSLNDRLTGGFRFDRRTAPRAEDPVNVMLNIAYTALYRQTLLAIRQAGLTPTIGLYHHARPGHAALASDLQEPLRHLMDRTVIQATFRLRPEQFHRCSDGPFKLRLDWRASRQFMLMIQQTLAHGVRPAPDAEPRPWRQVILDQARSLRRHLLNPSQPLEIFQHP